MENRYTALRVGKVAFKVLAWVSAVLGLVLSVVLFAGGGGPDVPRVAGLIWLVNGALSFLIFHVLGEGIGLLLEIRASLNK